MKRCRKSGNSVAQITGESRSGKGGIGGSLKQPMRVCGPVLQGTAAPFFALSWVSGEYGRNQAAARHAARHEHMLGEVVAKILHAPEELRR